MIRINNNITNVQVIRYAIILELFMEETHGTLKELKAKFKETKEPDCVIRATYDAVMHIDNVGFEELNSWLAETKGMKKRFKEYASLVGKQMTEYKKVKGFPLMYSYHWLKAQLPEAHPVLRQSSDLDRKFMKLRDKANEHFALDEDEEDELAYFLDRQLDKPD